MACGSTDAEPFVVNRCAGDRRSRRRDLGQVEALAAFGRQLLIAAVVAVAAVLTAAACGRSSPTDPGGQGAVFRILSSSESGETFDVLIHDPQRIAEAQSLVGEGHVKIINGRLARGDGGFNAPWSWHMVPASIEFADVTIEVCDGRPSDVEADVDYWVDTVGRFCPWGTEVVARVR